MYAYFYGEVSEIGADSLVLDVNNIGYFITCDLFTLSALKVGDVTKIYTFLNVKEDSMTLYGFGDKATKEMFGTLIGVNGVGPKVAMKALSAMKPDEIALAVLSDNPKAFKGISGLGPKIASRIVLELKSKMGSVSSEQLAGAFVSSGETAATPMGVVKDAIDALMGLGYSYNEAANLVKSVNREGMSVEDVIGAALKMGR